MRYSIQTEAATTAPSTPCHAADRRSQDQRVRPSAYPDQLPTTHTQNEEVVLPCNVTHCSILRAFYAAPVSGAGLVPHTSVVAVHGLWRTITTRSQRVCMPCYSLAESPCCHLYRHQQDYVYGLSTKIIWTRLTHSAEAFQPLPCCG